MVRLVVSDVDGVLTDGRINVGEDGELFKSFDVKDGLAIVRWMEDGGDFAIITSRTSNAVAHRSAELGVETVRQGVGDKLSVVEELAAEYEVSLDSVAYVGDDDSDVSALETVGIGAVPGDASNEARRAADYVCERPGGEGAVREFLEQIGERTKSAVGVIPARYGSRRLPGKPLVEIAGKPMIQRVYERASAAAELDSVVVATDDERIVDAVESVGGDAVMTNPDHPTGTDRVAAVVADREFDIVVNIQGDEPLLDPGVIDATVAALRENPPRIATPVSTIDAENELDSPHTVKVVTDAAGRALYFSRSRIPSKAEPGAARKHIGIYAFETDVLLSYVDMNSDLEAQEDLEQLRLLENGHAIQTVDVEYDARDVNVEEDVRAVEEFIEDNDGV